MDKRNSSAGRHPVVVAVLVGLLLGQLAFFFQVFFGAGVESFSGVISGAYAVIYNLLGVLSCGFGLWGIHKEAKNAPIGEYLTGLITELYSMGALGLTVLVYSAHTAARPGGSFPFILSLVAVGCLWRWWDIRKELKEIQADLLLLKRLQEFTSNGGEEHE